MAAYRIDEGVMAGKFSGLPYLALVFLFAAIFMAYHLLNKEE